MRRMLLVALSALLVSAHVGDNNTYFRGTAGPYEVQVTVRHPGVVPGLADVLVRVDGDAHQVTVRPVKYPQGVEGAPRPDVAKPVPGSQGLFSAELWFMEAGAYSVHVTVAGARGRGAVAVPVSSMATERLGVGRGLGIVLIALGTFLAIGLITIVRAAVRESVLPPGAEPTPQLIRRGRIATVAAAAVVAVMLWGGAAWWDAEDTAYGEAMFRPLASSAHVDSGTARVLSLAITDERWLARAWTPIIPDHGKMMHMFLVRLPEMDVFAHVHPDAVHTDTFRVSLPPLPAGSYSLYGDVVHESGFAQTLTDTVRIPAGAETGAPADADDSWWMRDVPAPSSSSAVGFADGVIIEWQRPAVVQAGTQLDLSFVVRRADGGAPAVEYYMGMPAHAAVRREDGGVFVHLHPTGSIAMAAQAAQTAQLTGQTQPHEGHEAHAAPARVSIPYAFPDAGRYRLWVQMRVDGAVRTAAWDVAVSAR